MIVEAHPLAVAERPVGAVASIVDESRLRRLEAVRSDFVANVSHELKTPVGGLALLAEALAEADEGERGRLAGRLHQEAHRVGRVIDDLLALSEIESDLPPDRVPIGLGDLVDRVDAEVALLADGLDVEIDLDRVDRSLTVVGDRVRLTSALTNLVENAVKYSGGASPVRVWAEGDATMVRVGVSDQGIGIPRQDLDRVFERFYRVDRARSTATGGTGLGLAIVRNVVEGHGGTVEVASREGVGSTFTIVLPRDADEGRASTTPAGTPVHGDRSGR
jgi:two-component system sensor histidine kinase SenX3